jgi:hypothetical protein
MFCAESAGTIHLIDSLISFLYFEGRGTNIFFFAPSLEVQSICSIQQFVFCILRVEKTSESLHSRGENSHALVVQDASVVPASFAAEPGTIATTCGRIAGAARAMALEQEVGDPQNIYHGDPGVARQPSGGRVSVCTVPPAGSPEQPLKPQF